MKNCLLTIGLCLLFASVSAQGEKEYSDEELTKYASVMKWAKDEKAKMTGIYNGWIKSNDQLEAALFVKIKRAGSDSVKLQELEVSEEELTAFNGIINSYDSMVSAFTDVYKGRIKDDIGAGLYNTLRKDLKKDETLKGRYDAIYEGLGESDPEEGTED